MYWWIMFIIWWVIGLWGILLKIGMVNVLVWWEVLAIVEIVI